MKPRHSLRNFLAAIGCATIAISAAKADTLYWSGNGTTAGGAGTWNTADARWGSLFNGPFSTVWNNSNNDTAVFGGTAGNVTLDTDITVGGIRFNTTAYTITTGTNTLTLGGTDNTINLSNIAAATITGTIASSGNFILTGVPGAAGTLTLNSTGNGWSGTTTVGAGRTLTLGANNTALINTSAININGSTITINKSGVGANQVSDTAAITFNGGGTYQQTNGSSGPFSETLGAVTVTSGQANFNYTNGASSGGVFTELTSLTRSVNAAAVAFGNANAAQTSFRVTGAADTAADEIIGAWATFGTSVANQNDYAIYTGANGTLAARNIASSAESTWSTTTSATSNYTLTNAAGSADNGLLTATRNINTLRNTTVATAAAANATTEFFTLAGNTFANGDVVSATGTGGLTVGNPYYVINVGGDGPDTFQLSNTSGGAALNLTNTTAGQIAGGVTLSAGNNLGTTGILNGNASTLAIGDPGGVVTLPTTTSGNLFVAAGAGAIAIDAPIADNGAGVLTLVKSGNAALRLSGANTYTGGTVINAGALTFANAGSWVSGQNVTFGGTGSYAATAGSITGGTLNINLGAEARITGNSNTTYTSTTGAGTLIYGGASSAILDLGDASGFTGNAILSVGIGGTNPRPTLRFSGMADTAGSLIGWGANGQGDSNQRAQLELSGNGGQLTFDNRQLVNLPRTGGNNAAKSLILGNNNSNATHTWIISTDFLNNGDRGGQALIFEGSNTGNNAFNGVIGNSTLNNNAMNVAKTGTGKWILGGDNTFTGRLIAGQGTLSVATLNESNVAGPLGMNNNIQLGGDERTNVGGTTIENRLVNNNSGTLEYTGAAVTSSRSFFIGNTVANGTGGGTIANNGTGAITFTAAEFNPAIAGITATRTLTLGGSYTGAANEIEGIIQDNVASTGRVAITKTDGSTWVLSGDNTYTGATTVTAGTLIINGDQSLATGAVAVNGTSTLGGSGTIAGAVTVAAGAMVAPGNSVGTLTFTGDLNISAMADGAGTLNLELGPIAASDTIVAGTINIGSGVLNFADFIFSDIGGLQNGTYTLIQSGGITGDLDTEVANLTGTVGAGTGTLQITGNDIELVVSGIGGPTAPYDTWSSINAPTGTPADDFDGDGVSNAIEFILGGDKDTNELGKLPVVTTSATDMTFTFVRDQDSVDASVGVEIEVSTDLVDWTETYTVGATSTADVTVTDNLDGTDTITLTVTRAPDDKKFARLKVTIDTP